jgi:hypothetical protein
MKSQYKWITLCICVSIIASCSSSDKPLTAKKEIKKSVVISPFKNVILPKETFTVLPGTDQVLTTLNGSKITIHKESLVDENGELIKEPVTISLKSFMDPAEILTAGIPMKYSDDSTKSTPFQSAGMFEIQAKTTSGKNVLINQEHPLSMDLATYRKEIGFDNYILDTLTGKWTKTESENLHLNLDKENVKAQLAKLKAKTAFNGNLFVFDFDYLLDEFLNNDYNAIYPYMLNQKKKLPNKLLRYGIDAEKIWDYQTILLNNNEIPACLVVWEKITKIDFPKWTVGRQAIHKNIEKDIYELTITNKENKNQEFTIKIRPRMSIKSLFKVDPEKWSAEFEKTLKEIQDHEITLSKMNDLSRTLTISEFGIYNCDRLYKQPEAYFSMVEFTFPTTKHGFTPDRFFYVSKRDKICIDYDVKKENRLTLCNDPSATLYTVLEGDLLAEVPANELLKCTSEKSGKQHLTFKTKSKIEKIEDLKKLMGI